MPNLAGVLAESPAALEGYSTLAAIFDTTTLTPAERQVVLLTVSRENACHYCIATHSIIARIQNVPEEVIAAIRDNDFLPDDRLEALRDFTSSVAAKRGRIEEIEITDFLRAGFTRAHILDVILGVALKTISNYTNHLAAPPIDRTFAAAARSTEAACACG